MLTQVVVVFETVTQSHQTENNMPDRCKSSQSSWFSEIQLELPSYKAGTICSFSLHDKGDSRAAEGFLPKYFAWYQPIGPPVALSGPAPFGSLS